MENSLCAPLGTTAVGNFYTMDLGGLSTSFRARLSSGTWFEFILWFVWGYYANGCGKDFEEVFIIHLSHDPEQIPFALMGIKHSSRCLLLRRKMADTESTEVSDVRGLTDQITIVINFSYEAPVDQNVAYIWKQHWVRGFAFLPVCEL